MSQAVAIQSNIKYDRVKVIGEVASFAIIRFNDYEQKRDFKMWLVSYSEDVKNEKGIWFGDNIDKEARQRERDRASAKSASSGASCCPPASGSRLLESFGAVNMFSQQRGLSLSYRAATAIAFRAFQDSLRGRRGRSYLGGRLPCFPGFPSR